MNIVTFTEDVASDTRPGRTYRITGELSCACAGFATHGRCKHLRRKVNTLLAPTPKRPRSHSREALSGHDQQSPEFIRR